MLYIFNYTLCENERNKFKQAYRLIFYHNNVGLQINSATLKHVYFYIGLDFGLVKMLFNSLRVYAFTPKMLKVMNK